MGVPLLQNDEKGGSDGYACHQFCHFPLETALAQRRILIQLKHDFAPNA